MKLLLDENFPVGLRHEIEGHECVTIAYQNWRGIQNGQLLALAADANFDALLTNDGNLPYQQNQQDLAVAVIVLQSVSNDLDDIRPRLPQLQKALENLKPNAITWVG